MCLRVSFNADTFVSAVRNKRIADFVVFSDILDVVKTAFNDQGR